MRERGHHKEEDDEVKHLVEDGISIHNLEAKMAKALGNKDKEEEDREKDVVSTTITFKAFDKRNAQCYTCQKFGHYSNEYKSHVQCYNCQKYGHYAHECRGKQPMKEEKANFAEQEVINGDSLMLMAHSSTEEDQII